MKYRLIFQLILVLGLASCMACCSDEREDDVTGWHLLQEAVVPFAGNSRAVAFDTDRNVLIIHGGNAISDTWEFDGRSWREIQTRESPPGLRDSAACYASDYRRMFIFGGLDVEQETNALWGYDGVSWQEYEMEVRPLARQRAAMCYDEHRKRLVLFGGTTDSVESKCTWEWDGSVWIPKMTEHYPVSCQWQRMVYDPVRRRVVLFGGKQSTTMYQDTWVYNGQDWTQLDIANPPEKRYNHGLAFDRHSGDVLLVGGYSYCHGGVSHKDFWRFNGSTWRKVLSFPEETQCDNPFIAAHCADRDFWLYSSKRETVNISTSYTKMYRLNDERLEAFSVPSSPKPIRLPSLLTFDTVSRHFLYLIDRDAMAGAGYHSIGVWWYSRNGWSQAASPVVDTPYLWYIDPVTLVHDSRRGTSILIPKQIRPSGMQGDQPFILFEFRNDAWKTREFRDGPKFRSGYRAVYDEKRGKLVLFGGRLSNAYNYSPHCLSNDTWEYDGESWVRIQTNRAPAAREDVVMAYDSKRGVVVMHGGLPAYGHELGRIFCDTWELDGQTWRLLPTRHVPKPYGDMVYDGNNDRMLFFSSFNTENYHMGPIEIWQFDRQDWTLLAFNYGPSQRWSAAVAVDTVSHNIVLTGGEFRCSQYYSEHAFIMTHVWELRP